MRLTRILVVAAALMSAIAVVHSPAQAQAVCDVAGAADSLRTVGADATGYVDDFLDELFDAQCFGKEELLEDGSSSMPCVGGAGSRAAPLCSEFFKWATCLNLPSKCDDDTLAARPALEAEALRLNNRISNELGRLKEVEGHQGSAVTDTIIDLVEVWQADEFAELDRRARYGSSASLELRNELRLVKGEGEDLEIVDARRILKGACDTPSDECAKTFEVMVEALILFGLQGSLVSALSADQLEKAREAIGLLDAQWSNFFEKGRASLPWELAIAGWRDSPREGFRHPPSSQIILLHPTITAVVDGFTTDEMTGALSLELLGFYAWRWDGAEMKAPVGFLPGFLDDYPLGGSIVLSFDANEDPGLGLMVHLPKNWSIGGIVDNDGDASLLLSLDVAKFFTDPDSQRSDLIDSFRSK